MVAATLDVDLAFDEARKRGAARTEEMVSGPDMLTGAAIGRLIGAKRETVRRMAKRRELLALADRRGQARYPIWQVMEGGGLAPDLPEIFAALGHSPWAVYRFLVQPIRRSAAPRRSMRFTPAPRRGSSTRRGV